MDKTLKLLPVLFLIYWGCEDTKKEDNIPTEVTLWGVVYSVEDTDSLDLFNNELTGSIPSEIGNLTNLTYLSLSGNDLKGEIPESICDLNLDFSSLVPNISYFNISNNQLCPPYPSCIEDNVGEQDTINCD